MSYNKKTWSTGEIIQQSALNNIEEGIYALDQAINSPSGSVMEKFEDLRDSIALEYSTSKTYAVGDYVWYDGKLYRCNTAISTAEVWTAAHWTETQISDDVADVKSALTYSGIGNSFDGELYNGYWDASGDLNSYNSDVCPANKIECSENASVVIIGHTAVEGIAYFVSYYNTAGTTRLRRDTGSGVEYTGVAPSGTKYITFEFEKSGLSKNDFSSVEVYINNPINTLNNSVVLLKNLEDAFDSVTTPEKEAITGAQTMSTTINNTKKVVDVTAAYYTVSYTASAGDKFIVNGAASNNGYVYIFTDSNDDTLSRYPEQNTSGGVKNYSGLEVTAPTGTAHIIIASHTNYTPAYLQKITGYSVDGMDELDGRLDDIEAMMTPVPVPQDVPSTDITLHDNHYMGSNGVESAEYTAWQYAEYAIPSNAVSLTVTGEAGQNAALWVLKNSSGTVLGASSWTSSASLKTETINLASYTGAAKVFVSDKKSGHLAILYTYNVQRIDGDNVYVNGQELSGTVEDLDERVEDIEDVIIDVQIPQDVPAADITIHDNHYIGTSGSESAEYSMWQYAEYTLPDGVASVRVTGAAGQLAPLWMLENATGTVIGYSSDSSAVSTKTETVSLATYTGAKKLFVNDKKSGALAIVLIYNGKAVDGDAVYIDGQSLPDVLDEIGPERSDKLYGKILCCVGDSITYGADMDSDGITNTSHITVYNCNDSGVFSQTLSGFRKTWGWQIANRHNMTFYNGGVSGSTMQNVTGHAGFSAADGRYTKLPDTLDYLLIWFGWNDNAYGTLGTIADDDNDSYYGGYNVVLPYLLNKYTYAKIGLIVPFGASAGHREAIRLLGNKWGVAVWDNYQGGTPLYYGKEDSVGVEASVVTANHTKFQANGAHPNYKGHTQLADMIEEWLKGI